MPSQNVHTSAKFSDHLLIAVGIVTTGPDCEHDEIRELAAKLVVPPWLERETFNSPTSFHAHVKTNEINISLRNKLVHFDNNEQLKEEQRQRQQGGAANCATVLNDFLEWLQFVVREARRNTDCYLITALVGHFALWKDFKFLVRCCENNCPSNVRDVIGLWCQFADSGDLLCKVKRNRIEFTNELEKLPIFSKSNFQLKKMNLWQRNVKTDLASVYPHLLGENLPKKASAEQKAEALAKVLALPALTRHLEHLDLLTYQGFKSRCEKDESSVQFFDDLMNKFGPDLVNTELLQRMARKRISFQHVQNAFWSSRNHNLFKAKIKRKLGVDLDTDEANELYDACKITSRPYNCCIHFANKMPKTTFKYK
uniref:Uncharacterized protein n=1 Tax=Strigamia maritima TaxID=126957 RepID=T1JHI8_STRMM